MFTRCHQSFYRLMHGQRPLGHVDVQVLNQLAIQYGDTTVARDGIGMCRLNAARVFNVSCRWSERFVRYFDLTRICLLYTSDAADE